MARYLPHVSRLCVFSASAMVDTFRDILIRIKCKANESDNQCLNPLFSYILRRDYDICQKVTQPDFQVKNLTQKTFKLQLSVKIFTTGKNFTWLLIVTVATNLTSETILHSKYKLEYLLKHAQITHHLHFRGQRCSVHCQAHSSQGRRHLVAPGGSSTDLSSA